MLNPVGSPNDVAQRDDEYEYDHLRRLIDSGAEFIVIMPDKSRTNVTHAVATIVDSIKVGMMSQ